MMMFNLRRSTVKDVNTEDNLEFDKINPDEYNAYYIELGSQLPIVPCTYLDTRSYNVEITYDLDGSSYKDFGFVLDLDMALKIIADEISSDDNNYSGNEPFKFMIYPEQRKILIDFNDPYYYGRITY